MTTTDLTTLTDRELARDIASAVRDRDASYAAAELQRYPAALARLRLLRAERSRRRSLPRSLTPAAEVDWCDDAGCPRDECVACVAEARKREPCGICGGGGHATHNCPNPRLSAMTPAPTTTQED